MSNHHSSKSQREIKGKWKIEKYPNHTVVFKFFELYINSAEILEHENEW